MSKVIAAINMTLDGYFDHTAMIADDELHQHYNDLLRNGGTILYGRKTYQLMESYWPMIVKNPTGNQPEDEFAIIIDNISKIVFSHTLKDVSWKNTKLARTDIEEEVIQLRLSGSGENKDILIGSGSLIITLLNLDLIDEFQICIHPIILGKGLPLLKNIIGRIDLKLIKTKTFSSGSIVLYYERAKK